LVSISISKFTHIKIDPDARKEDYRVHHGKDTQLEVDRIVREVYELEPILKVSKAKLSAAELLEAAAAEAEGADKSVVGKASTQFRLKELDSALKKSDADAKKNTVSFLEEVRAVFYTAWVQSLTAVRVGVGKSEKDGTEAERKAALEALPPQAQASWGQTIDPNGKVTRF
jgi:hypothetical protein